MSPSRPISVTLEPLVPRAVLASIDIDVASPRLDGEIDTFESPGLHEAERQFAASLSAAQRPSFVAGRQALRAALQHVAPDQLIAPLLRTHRGAPVLPAGLTGSISHKRERAIAVAAPSSGDMVGVDLEERPLEKDLTRRSIAERILTGRELERLEGLDALAHREATLVHFALKEAVYKAIDPYVERYVRFTEVELDVHPSGRAVVRLSLPESSVQHVNVDAIWRFDGRWIIAMARSSRP
jgi:enterobactin synthetase component D